MSEYTTKLAEDIASQNQIDWIFYLVMLAIVVIGSYFGSLICEYAKKRGGQLATRTDLYEIQEQLKKATEITEQVRNDIEHGVWRAKELEILKREKLEQYLINYYETIENMSKKMKRDFFYDESHFDESCEAKLSMLQKLYLPDLDNEYREFLKVSAKFSHWLADGQMELLAKKQNGAQKPVISREHMEYYPKLLANLNSATLLIEAKAKKIGREINIT